MKTVTTTSPVAAPPFSSATRTGTFCTLSLAASLGGGAAHAVKSPSPPIIVILARTPMLPLVRNRLAARVSARYSECARPAIVANPARGDLFQAGLIP